MISYQKNEKNKTRPSHYLNSLSAEELIRVFILTNNESQETISTKPTRLTSTLNNLETPIKYKLSYQIPRNMSENTIAI